jgi:hypothetical protein
MHLDAVTFWLLAVATAAAQTRGRSTQLAGCNVAGFVLKTKQLPRALSSPDAAVVYTIEDEDTAHLQVTPDVAATAAVCKRNEACAMFTSDGILMGFYREAENVDAFNAAIAHEQLGGGSLLWVPMQNCSGRCCGTWVAENRQQQLWTPAVGSSSGLVSANAVGANAMAHPVTDLLKIPYQRAVTALNSTVSIRRNQSGAAASSGH